MTNSKTSGNGNRDGQHYPSGFNGQDDGGTGFSGGVNGFDDGYFGLGQFTPSFITLVDAIIAAPPNPFVTAGQNGATGALSNLLWAYSPDAGLMLETKAGFLTTPTGNGGFNLFVGTNGAWSLRFDGTDTVIGNNDSGNGVIPPPPAGNTVVDLPAGANFYPASTPNVTFNGGTGWDTIQGGVGDYMIGGSGTLGAGLAGKGNCALYSASPGSVLVDMQSGFGYGGSASGNVLVNMNQVRGSAYSNVLIGNSTGTDLKSGGNNSVLISTGGSGFELRPDGSGNILVSTIGADRINFDPTHGWLLGDDNTLLGFSAAHGDFLDLSLLLSGRSVAELNGQKTASDFFSASAAGYSAASGTGNINDYVRIIDEADGSHVMFSATGQVQASGTEILDMKFAHGLSVQTLYQGHNIVA